MIRAVLDTNVIVSALLFRGITSQLVSYWQQGKLTPVVSKAVMAEYVRVLAYPRFHLTGTEVRMLIERHLVPFIDPVVVKQVPSVIQEDPSDDIFLACAVAGKVRYIVSGDGHLLNLKKYKNISIVTPLLSF